MDVFNTGQNGLGLAYKVVDFLEKLPVIGSFPFGALLLPFLVAVCHSFAYRLSSGVLAIVFGHGCLFLVGQGHIPCRVEGFMVRGSFAAFLRKCNHSILVEAALLVIAFYHNVPGGVHSVLFPGLLFGLFTYNDVLFQVNGNGPGCGLDFHLAVIDVTDFSLGESIADFLFQAVDRTLNIGVGGLVVIVQRIEVVIFGRFRGNIVFLTNGIPLAIIG